MKITRFSLLQVKLEVKESSKIKISSKHPSITAPWATFSQGGASLYQAGKKELGGIKIYWGELNSQGEWLKFWGGGILQFLFLPPEKNQVKKAA